MMPIHSHDGSEWLLMMHGLLNDVKFVSEQLKLLGGT